ncbi:NAD-dependent epimerase/dehydratase family protein [Chitinophaga defluvii]|uniref:NAD-dependent epimerase/dehydratase family protein n=1 Tax=Chitinophaga defluvii TaxID=3163343 RepID=A0ABV2T0P4_9BACT
MKDDVLLTGASGFLGNQIIKTLSNKYNFFTIGRQTEELVGRHLRFNISEGVTNKLPKVRYVIHCAGKAHSVPRSVKESKVFFEVNLQGTINFCQSLIESNTTPDALIFISTVAVYGKDAGVMITEDDALDAISPYAKSKAMAETYLQNWANENGVRLGILRLPLIAGPNPPGNLGAMIRGIRSGRYLSIGKADARKSIVWASDVAEIIPNVAKIGGIYNLTDGEHPSFKELEHAIATILGKNDPLSVPLPIAKVLGYAGDLIGSKFPVNSDKLKKIISTLTFNDAKARAMLNWNPCGVIDKIHLIV